MKTKNIKTSNNRVGNKKITLLLVLRALEQESHKDYPIRQIDLVKRVNDFGGNEGLIFWIDRKTVARHIELLKAVGYNIVFVKGKGYYLESHKFNLAEAKAMILLVKESNLSTIEKNQLVYKMFKNQQLTDIAKLSEYIEGLNAKN